MLPKVTVDFEEPDFALRWPIDLLLDELAAAFEAYPDPSSAVDRVLEEAFAGPEPARQWRLGRWPMCDSDDRAVELLTSLTEAAQRGELRPPAPRRRRWSERHQPPDHEPTLDGVGLRTAFATLIDELDADGYFARTAPRPCVDDDFGPPELAAVVKAELGADLWPFDPAHPDQPADDRFFDLIEAFHDLAARPRSRYVHDFADGGWHYGSFAVLPGQRLYRWRSTSYWPAARSGCAWRSTARTAAAWSNTSTTPARTSSNEPGSRPSRTAPVTSTTPWRLSAAATPTSPPSDRRS